MGEVIVTLCHQILALHYYEVTDEEIKSLCEHNDLDVGININGPLKVITKNHITNQEIDLNVVDHD
jgi:hypothetical protein